MSTSANSVAFFQREVKNINMKQCKKKKDKMKIPTQLSGAGDFMISKSFHRSNWRGNDSVLIILFLLSFLLFLQGAVITPAMDHTMSMQPASMMGPLTQQMNHLSLGTTGSVSTPNCALMNHTKKTWTKFWAHKKTLIHSDTQGQLQPLLCDHSSKIYEQLCCWV